MGSGARAAILVALVAAASLPGAAAAVGGDRAGDLDTTFGSTGSVAISFSSSPNVSAFSTAVTAQPDGKVVEVGAVTTFASGVVNQDFALLRLNADGSPDATFGNGGKVVTDVGTQGDVAQAVAIDSSGRIVVAGQDQAQPGGNEDLVVARYSTNGSLDPSFGDGGIAIVHDAGFADFAYAVAVTPDGDIVAAGNRYGTTNGANNDFLVVRLTSGGSLDPAFGAGGEVAFTFRSGNANQAAYALAIAADGRVVVGGFSNLWDATPPADFALARLRTDGSLDPAFGDGGKVLTDFGDSDTLVGLAMLSNGELIAAGPTGADGGGIALARYDATGTLDPSFGQGGREIAHGVGGVAAPATLALDAEKRIVVAAASVTVQPDLEVARFEPDGSPDPTFGSNGVAHANVDGANNVTGMALEPDGNILLADLRGGGAMFGVSRFLAGPIPSAFVATSGASLRLSGRPFRPIGINIYNANSRDNCWYDMAHGSTLDDALTAIGSGANTIRAWFFQDLATTNGKRDWVAFDHTLAVARAHGVKVIATLGNQWQDCEPAAGYKSTSWYAGGYKQPDPGGTVSYRDWVQEVAARYRDDPTVLAWQLMNEPEVMPYAGADCGQVPESTAEADLYGFANDVSAAIKAVDPNHLVSLGTIGSGQCGAQGPDYATVMGIHTLDLCEFHDYNPVDLVPGDQWNGLATRIDECATLGKPLLVGELGVRPVDVGNTYAARAATISGKLCAQLSAGVAGTLVWAWDKDGSRLNDYDIGPADPVLSALAPWTDPSLTCSAPGPPRSPVAAAGDSSVSVSWIPPTSDGGAPVSGYVVTAQPGTLTTSVGAGSTSVLVTGLSNGTAYTFTVTARNAAGVGPASVATVAVTPTAGAGTPASASGTAAPGGTVTTDPSNSGPTAAMPVTGTVTVPAGGDVAITVGPPGSAPTGFAFLGKEVTITAPSASAAAPLSLSFTLDASLLGTSQASDVQIFRTESGIQTQVAGCTSSDGSATPDPCVASRTLLGSGDVRVTVLTSSASLWDFGVGTDTTPPTVSLTRPADGASYVLGSSLKAAYTCADTGGSGLASCVGSVPNGGTVSTSTVGQKTFTVTARDGAGHQTVVSSHFSVVYAFTGFQPPVSNAPALNATKAGGAVPFKFLLAGNFGLAVLSGAPTSAPINCTSHAATGSAVGASGSLAYDSTAKRYTYTWQTVKTWANTCRSFTLVLNDGTTHTAFFRFGA